MEDKQFQDFLERAEEVGCVRAYLEVYEPKGYDSRNETVARLFESGLSDAMIGHVLKARYGAGAETLAHRIRQTSFPLEDLKYARLLFSDFEKKKVLTRLIESGVSATHLSRLLQVGKGTIYKYLKHEIPKPPKRRHPRLKQPKDKCLFPRVQQNEQSNKNIKGKGT